MASHPHRNGPWSAVALALVVMLTASGCATGEAGAEFADADAGSWETWVVDDVAALEVSAPPAEGSEAPADDERRLDEALAEEDTEAGARVARWDAEVAMEPWLEEAWEFVAQASKQVPRSSRGYGLVTAAMADAAIAAWHHKGEHERAAPDVDGLAEPEAGWSYPSAHAAVAGAASRVLAEVYPEQAAPRLDDAAQEAAWSRVEGGAAYPSDVEAGLELGRQVAGEVIAYADGDGYELEWDESTQPEGPRVWDPPPGSAARPDAPRAGEWATWYLDSGDQLRVDEPPEPVEDDAEFMEQIDAVLAQRETRTEAQAQFARDWEGPEGTALPGGLWTQEAVPHVGAAGWSLPRQARALALLNTAMHDATVAVWDSKYAYWYPRPVNIIRQFGIDEDYDPLLTTPVFPAYPSGNNGYAGAAREVLAHLFPDDAEAWHELGADAGTARLWGEVHWPVDNAAGMAVGREVGRMAVERAESDGAQR